MPYVKGSYIFPYKTEEIEVRPGDTLEQMIRKADRIIDHDISNYNTFLDYLKSNSRTLTDEEFIIAMEDMIALIERQIMSLQNIIIECDNLDSSNMHKYSNKYGETYMQIKYVKLPKYRKLLDNSQKRYLDYQKGYSELQKLRNKYASKRVSKVRPRSNNINVSNNNTQTRKKFKPSSEPDNVFVPSKPYQPSASYPAPYKEEQKNNKQNAIKNKIKSRIAMNYHQHKLTIKTVDDLKVFIIRQINTYMTDQNDLKEDLIKRIQGRTRKKLLVLNLHPDKVIAFNDTNKAVIDALYTILQDKANHIIGGRHYTIRQKRKQNRTRRA